MSLALFDLDETIISRDSDYTWSSFLVDKNLFDEKTLNRLRDRFKQDYLNGRLDIHEYYSFVGSFLGQFSMSKLEELREEYVVERVVPFILPKAVSVLDWHRKNKDFSILISATNSFLVKRIAQEMAFNHVIATDIKIEDQRFIGKIDGVPSFREGKVTRIKDWLIKNPTYSMNGSWFYSDSLNDIPLLEAVDQPIAVDPDDTLRKHALSKGWKITSFR